MKPWHTKEWREKRREFLEGKKCEWCGSTEHLVIDHLKNSYPDIEFKRIGWQYFMEYFAKRRNQREFLSLLAETVKGVVLCIRYVCPKCRSNRIFPEKERKVTIYKCSECGHEFLKPLKLIFPPSGRWDVLKRMVNLFISHHRDEIYAKFQVQWQRLTEEYLNFENVIVLCQSCAFARLLGFRLCPICKQQYYRDIPTSSRKMCWVCFIRIEEGKKYLAELQRRKKREIREKDFAVDELRNFLKGMSREELNDYIQWRLRRKAIKESMESVMRTNAWKKVNTLLNDVLGFPEYHNFSKGFPPLSFPSYILSRADKDNKRKRWRTLEEMIEDLIGGDA